MGSSGLPTPPRPPGRAAGGSGLPRPAFGTRQGALDAPLTARARAEHCTVAIDDLKPRTHWPGACGGCRRMERAPGSCLRAEPRTNELALGPVLATSVSFLAQSRLPLLSSPPSRPCLSLCLFRLFSACQHHGRCFLVCNPQPTQQPVPREAGRRSVGLRFVSVCGMLKADGAIVPCVLISAARGRGGGGHHRLVPHRISCISLDLLAPRPSLHRARQVAGALCACPWADLWAQHSRGHRRGPISRPQHRPELHSIAKTAKWPRQLSSWPARPCSWPAPSPAPPSTPTAAEAGRSQR